MDNREKVCTDLSIKVGQVGVDMVDTSGSLGGGTVSTLGWNAGGVG